MRTNTNAQYLRHLADDVIPQVLYVQRHSEDAHGIQRVLEYRSRVAGEFEQLTTRRESATAVQDSPGNAADVLGDPHKQIESKPGPPLGTT